MTDSLWHADDTQLGFDPSLFIGDVDEYTCPICFNVCKEPHETICGHVFCKICIHRSLRTQLNCPVCREQLREPYSECVFYTKKLERDILNLQIQCPRQPCEWTGKLNDYLTDHKNLCNHELVDCPFVTYGCPFKNNYRSKLATHMKAFENHHLWLHSKVLSNKLSELTGIFRLQMKMMYGTAAKVREAAQRNEDLTWRANELTRKIRSIRTRRNSRFNRSISRPNETIYSSINNHMENITGHSEFSPTSNLDRNHSRQENRIIPESDRIIFVRSLITDLQQQQQSSRHSPPTEDIV